MKHKKKGNLITRPPVVVVLGHVDHGKTAILDFIRKSKVVEQESGGITQHIGAYQIAQHGKEITFIDTPGHEAFGAMRSRGAKVADIAVLVVAADEGVKPQTKEAISHIKKAGIPMIVAINKIDKPGADPEKVKRELSQVDVLVESMGGKVASVNVSATQGTGISELLEIILLVAEMEDFGTDISCPAEGVIIESYLDWQRGPTATLILSKGTLAKGDIVGTKSTLGRAKILEDFQGKPLAKAQPSLPVVLVGFEDVPCVGEQVRVCSDIEKAKAALVKSSKREAVRPVIKQGKQVLNLIIKGDVVGSLEAIEQVLAELPQENVVLRVLKKEVGQINESDIKLGLSARAQIIGFRVKVDAVAQGMTQRERIKIKTFDVIYELSQYVREQMEKVLIPKAERIEHGKLKALLVFRTEKNRQIIGGKIIEGQVKRGIKIEVFRDEELIGRGRVVNLQKKKKDIQEASKGEEVGILYEGDVKIQENDILLFYTKQREKPEL